MARSAIKHTRVAPETAGLLTLYVERTEQVTPSMLRVTLGGDDAERFVPIGHDQWFRLFLPTAEGDLSRVPAKLDTLSYLRFLTVSKATRPILRNYSVRAVREAGGGGQGGYGGREIDVDMVLHGVEDGQAVHAGPAVAWALAAQPGDPVGLLDEGATFSLPDDLHHLRMVADETALPAVANTLATLPPDVTGEVLVEIPEADDAQDFEGPDGVEVVWLPRAGTGAAHGQLAHAEAVARPAPSVPWFGWVSGEQSLASGVRRHWVEEGLPKDRVAFCGYWKAPKGVSHTT